jgi:hypothetical protein
MSINREENKGMVEVHSVAVESSDSESDHESSSFGNECQPKPRKPATLPSGSPDSIATLKVSSVDKLKEVFPVVAVAVRTLLKELPAQHHSLTSTGRFNHYVLLPWYEWFGQDHRIIKSPALGCVDLATSQPDRNETVINTGSFNYAGLYGISPEYERLHHGCLQDLPLVLKETGLIEMALQEEMKRFWSAACCYTTPTGYQSNVLALTSILDGDWLVITDDSSHSSIITGVRLAVSGQRLRFKHNDMEDLAEILEESKGRFTNCLVVVEGLYRWALVDECTAAGQTLISRQHGW